MIFLSNDIISTSNCVQGQTTRGALRRLSEYLRPRRIFIQFPRILRMASPPPRTHCFLQWKIWRFYFYLHFDGLWVLTVMGGLTSGKPVALLLRFVDLEGIQRSIWDEPKIRRCVRERCQLQTRLKKGFTNSVFQPNLKTRSLKHSPYKQGIVCRQSNVSFLGLKIWSLLQYWCSRKVCLHTSSPNGNNSH